MRPVLFEFSFGDGAAWSLGAYRFFAIAAALYGAFFLFRHLRRENLARLPSLCIVFSCGLVFFAGARLLHAVLHGPDFLLDPAKFFDLRFRNFAFTGGLALALPLFWALARHYRLPFLRLCDRLAPHAGVTAALMKTGCFLNGCCFGARTDLSWGVAFPRFSPAHLAQLESRAISLFGLPKPVHPTQLYEIAGALIASLIALLVLRCGKHPGLAAAAFALAFTTGRFATFFTRDFPRTDALSLWIQGPVLHLVAIVGLLLWIRHARHQPKPS